MDTTIIIRLDIDGNTYNCVTYDDTAIQITRRVYTLKNISSSQAVITLQEFTLPLVGDLLDALGDVTDITQEPNIDIRKKINGSILINGFQSFVGSFTYLGSFIDPRSGAKKVRLIFKGNETDLKAKLSDIKLSELFADETLPYNASEINDYYTNPTSYRDTNGYSWDMIDYGQGFTVGLSGGKRIDDSSNPLDQTDFKPSIFVRKVFDLLDSQGIVSITSSSSIDDLFDEQVIPCHNNDSNIPVLNNSPTDYTGSMTKNVTTTFSGVAISDGVPSINLIPFELKAVYNQDNFNLGTESYTAPLTGDYEFGVDLEMSISAALNQYLDIKVDVYVNGVFSELLLYGGQVVTGTASTISLSSKKNISLVRNDVVTYRIYVGVPIGGAANTVTYNLLADTGMFVNRSPIVAETSVVSIGGSVDQDFTCWKVLEGIIGQCNGIVEPTVSGFNIKPWVDWIEEGELLDITKNIDPSKDYQIEPTGVTGAKSIKITYKPDSDYYNEQFTKITGDVYGEFKIEDTGSEFATDEFKVEIPFSPTPVHPIPGSGIRIPKFINSDGKAVKVNPRLIHWNSNVYGQRWYLQDQFGGPLYTINGIPQLFPWSAYGGGFNQKSYNFGSNLRNYYASRGYPNNTLYELYWRKYIEEIYTGNAAKVTLSINLNRETFLDLKLNEKVFLSNRNLRFNSISNYDIKNNDPVQVELIPRKEVSKLDIAPFYPENVQSDGVVLWADSTDNSSLGESPTPAADLEASCIAYGFFYDSANNKGVQQGIIIVA